MIKFRLQCDADHSFDAWFSSGASYDQQAKRGLVSCPSCGSIRIEKALMAPNVATRSAEPSTALVEQSRSAAAPAAAPVAAMPQPQNEAQRQFVALMRKVRDEVQKNAEYVGPKFAEEVRKIHLDEAPNRGIYGEATFAEAQDLRDEGIDVFPLPILPEDRN